MLESAALTLPAGAKIAPCRRKRLSRWVERRRLEDPPPIEATADLGVPLGGIGAGTVSWSRLGGFTRWTMTPGRYRQFREPACGLALAAREGPGPDGPGPNGSGRAAAVALQPPPTCDRAPAGWEWAVPNGGWSALFPLTRQRHRFDDLGVAATVEGFSPVLPGDLATASLPVAVFQVGLTNQSDAPRRATAMLHWANMVGWFAPDGPERPYRAHAGATAETVRWADARAPGLAVAMTRAGERHPPPVGGGSLAIAAAGRPGDRLSAASMVDGRDDAGTLWRAFRDDGVLPECPAWVADPAFLFEELGVPFGAVAIDLDLAPGESRTVTLTLAWDWPTVQFPLGAERTRYYTQHWGATGTRAVDLARHGLDRAAEWRAAIDAWHGRTATALGPGPAAAGLALNELYFVTDGLTVLTAPTAAEPAFFGLIECPDYAYYNTLDLWVYAGEALLAHWPELEASVLEAYARTVAQADASPRKSLYGDRRFARKRAGFLPHDLGQPEEAPGERPNGYTLQDSTRWKDLNSQFVLAVWRAGCVLGRDWRAALYPAVRTAIEALAGFDRDGDGVIENDGFPDQTFDNIPMRGPSAYCGGLWLAALTAGARIAEEAADSDTAKAWQRRATAGRQAFVAALWAGDRFRVDTDGPVSGALFLEQLFGPFLAKRWGLGDLIDPDLARTALTTLYRDAFERAGGGVGPILLSGADNAATAAVADHGDPDVQIGEVLVGIAYSFAAQLRCWGLAAEADRVRAAMFEVLHRDRGLFFRTPAAISLGGRVYRAPLNLRPLAIWMDRPPPDLK